MTMPEEINRLVADRISDLLLAPERISSENLRKDGVPEDKIKFIGNITINTPEKNRNKTERLNINEIIRLNSIKGSVSESIDSLESSFAMMTLDRPSNVDRKISWFQL
jgi:UDP-N-acetylglucosamine 2-epimerase (non-hydrolysing)